jgi:hypothetical protein
MFLVINYVKMTLVNTDEVARLRSFKHSIPQLSPLDVQDEAKSSPLGNPPRGPLDPSSHNVFSTRLGGGAALRKPNQTLKIVEWSVAQENRKPEQKRCHVGADAPAGSGAAVAASRVTGTGYEDPGPPPSEG